MKWARAVANSQKDGDIGNLYSLNEDKGMVLDAMAVIYRRF